MTVLHVLIGIPGSGKSTLARTLEESEGACVVSSDRLREVITGSARDLSADDRMWPTFRAIVRDLLKDVDDGPVVADATNLTVKARHWYHDAGATLKVAHVMATPYSVACLRNELRAEPVPEHVMKSMELLMGEVTADGLLTEGFDVVYLYA